MNLCLMSDPYQNFVQKLYKMYTKIIQNANFVSILYTKVVQIIW